MVWVDPESDIPGLLGPTSWGSHRADLRFRMSALNRRMIILVPGPREVGPGSSSTRRSRPPAEPPRSGHTVAALRRSLGCDFGQRRVSGDHPQGMNCRVQPSSQAAQADTPRHQLINSTWHAPGSDCRSTHPYGADQTRWTPAAGSKSHETAAAGRCALTNEAGGHRGRALRSGRAGDHRRQAPSNVVLTGHAPKCPKHRSAAVIHGQPRSVPMPFEL
jgi:hypothetical protein